MIHAFNGPDGSDPNGALVFDQAGNLYGTAGGGGALNDGLIFELRPSADGTWTENILYSFVGGNLDGAGPQGNLVFDNQGNIYGTTGGGGPHNAGTVYMLSHSSGAWIETLLYTFDSGINGPGGAIPVGGLVMDREGRLYGVTSYGGKRGGGTVFRLSPSESGGYTEKIIHSFYGTDGSHPTSGLAIDKSGNLYATTGFGGSSSWCGTVTELLKHPDGSWSEDVLHAMNGSDGCSVVGPVAFDKAGNLYAASQYGTSYGMGSVFMLTPTQTGPWTETVLHRFDFVFPNGEDGSSPYAGVIVGDGKVFGTTAFGGIYDDGVIFEDTAQ